MATEIEISGIFKNLMRFYFLMLHFSKFKHDLNSHSPIDCQNVRICTTRNIQVEPVAYLVKIQALRPELKI